MTDGAAIEEDFPAIVVAETPPYASPSRRESVTAEVAADSAMNLVIYLYICILFRFRMKLINYLRFKNIKLK